MKKRSKVKMITIEVETNLSNKDIKAHARLRVAMEANQDNPGFVEVRKVDVNEAQPAGGAK